MLLGRQAQLSNLAIDLRLIAKFPSIQLASMSRASLSTCGQAAEHASMQPMVSGPHDAGGATYRWQRVSSAQYNQAYEVGHRPAAGAEERASRKGP